MSFFKNTRNLVTVAILGAIGAILMILNINIPSIMPVFIKLDFADLPAIIASFAFGPTGGLMVCLIKNLLNCENPNTCPHGRPTMLKYTNYELEKFFKRAG